MEVHPTNTPWLCHQTLKSQEIVFYPAVSIYSIYVLYWFVVLYHNPTLAESASIMCSESAWDYRPPTHIGMVAGSCMAAMCNRVSNGQQMSLDIRNVLGTPWDHRNSISCESDQQKSCQTGWLQGLLTVELLNFKSLLPVRLTYPFRSTATASTIDCAISHRLALKSL